VAGSIALRFGDLAYADHEFALALGRTPGEPMPRWSAGRSPRPRVTAASRLALLERAGRLNPEIR